ncbi:hypothetical protein [Lysobacter gummosus]|uniref:hypothetical protein n=1 Tax=Lysobacter gummosus TaxID=262324 RepID=UPI0036409C67
MEGLHGRSHWASARRPEVGTEHRPHCGSTMSAQCRLRQPCAKHWLPLPQPCRTLGLASFDRVAFGASSAGHSAMSVDQALAKAAWPRPLRATPAA